MSHDTPISAPRLPTPPDACDAHMHIYEPGYPMQRAEAAQPGQPATLAHYRLVRQQLGLTRAVIVQPSGYGTDNTCTLEAMAKLGDDARGIAIVDPAVSDAELERLTKLGIRGVRYYMRGGPLPWESMPELAARIAGFGWHVQLICAPRELADHAAILSNLPCDLVVDHMGRFDAGTPETDPAWRLLMKLLGAGRCWVKLSGVYYGSKSGPPRYEDKAPMAKALIRAAPERMVWASNWPHPAFRKNFPDEGKLLDLLADWTQDEALRRRILVTNPAKLYGFA